MSDMFEQAIHVARQHAARATTHYVEDTGYRQPSYVAICGAWVSAGEKDWRTSADPTCLTCARLLREVDADTECPY